jgi:prophage DNA circulation protein
LLFLAFTVLAPAVGALLLYGMRTALSDPDRYINAVSIRLFVLASGIRPWSHFVGLIKNRADHLQEQVVPPFPSANAVGDRLSWLETEVHALRASLATKADVRALRDGLDAPLTQLSKSIRKNERKEEMLRLASEERFAALDAKLAQSLRLASQADVHVRLIACH